jgi:DNA-binding HxlR family transcriptional regulator
MNLTPNSPQAGSGSRNPIIKGSAHAVWRYLIKIANQTTPPTVRFQVPRREIQKGTSIGSLNTVDDALEHLESFGLLQRYSLPGSNEGHIYELLTLDENPIPNLNRWGIAALLRQAADTLERDNIALTPEQIIKWSRLIFQARRLLPM